MTILQFRDIGDDDIPSVVALWTRAGLTRAWNDPERDIALARRDGNSTILLGFDADRLVATVMVGHDGHRGTVYYLGVDPDVQRGGFGRQTMQAAEAWLKERGIWKLNLLVRNENSAAIGFYEALGYVVEPNAQLGKRFDNA
ncbi:MAG: GNAT family acetyltransferase [Hyphomicrobiales bacterium]|nr:MAG: GNAT family acetyltransferase [Hyphomicrobiales bacterium]